MHTACELFLISKFQLWTKRCWAASGRGKARAFNRSMFLRIWISEMSVTAAINTLASGRRYLSMPCPLKGDDGRCRRGWPARSAGQDLALSAGTQDAHGPSGTGANAGTRKKWQRFRHSKAVSRRVQVCLKKSAVWRTDPSHVLVLLVSAVSAKASAPVSAVLACWLRLHAFLRSCVVDVEVHS